MSALYRHHTNKHRSAKVFKRHARHTKAPNLRHAPQRGGYRF